jgi:hypothetical protein
VLSASGSAEMSGASRWLDATDGPSVPRTAASAKVAASAPTAMRFRNLDLDNEVLLLTVAIACSCCLLPGLVLDATPLRTVVVAAQPASTPITRQPSPSGPTTAAKWLPPGPWTGTARAQALTSGPNAAT